MSFCLCESEREKIKDYVLLMLGAPVIKIELDPSQLNAILAEAEEHVRVWLSGGERTKLVHLVQQGALAYGKQVLGRIRSKYNQVNPEFKLDGKVLVDEAHFDLMEWKKLIKELAKKG